MSTQSSPPNFRSAPPAVLVVEDDYAIRKYLRIALEAAGYRYLEAADAVTAMKQLASDAVGAIVLDLGLPDRDGIDLLREIRTTFSMPIIIISARGQERSKIEALDTGADDYLTKPLSTGELLARLRAVMRRKQEDSSADQVLASGPIIMDIVRHQVTLRGDPISLTPLEFKLLEVLVRHAGRVLTHRFLLREVWGSGYGDRTHYVRIYMNSLRRKLQTGEKGQSCISTEIGVGYRLRDDIEPRTGH